MSEFFRNTPPGLLTDDDAGFLRDYWHTVPAADQPFYAAKLNEWQNFRTHYPRPLTPSEQAAKRTERLRLGEIFTDFDAATQGDSLSVLQFPDSDQAPELKRGLANRAFVSHLTGLEGDRLERDYELTRDALAKQLFGGSGVADDATFHSKAAEWVANENGKEEVQRSLADAGRRAAAWEGSGLAESVRPTLQTWQEGMTGKPGYELDFSGEYERAFKAATAGARAEFDRLRPYVDATWLTLTGGGDTAVSEPGAVDFEALADRLMEIPAADRRSVLGMVRARAELLPEKEQAGFWSKAGKAFARQGEAIGQGLVNELPRILGGVGGEGAADRERQALYEDIRNLQRLEIDPVNGNGMAESAGLAIAGSLPGLAAMWTISPWAMVGQYASDARQTIRSELEKKGVPADLSGEAANGLALPAAVAMSYLERVTLGMANSIPGVKQLQAKLLTRLSETGVKKALAIGGAFALETLEQGVQEALQDTTPLLLTDMAQTLGAPLPEVEAWGPAVQTLTDPSNWAVAMVFAGIGFGRMPDLEAASILRERGASDEQIQKVLAAPDADTWRTAVTDALTAPANPPTSPDVEAAQAGQAVENAAAGVTGITRDAGGWWVEHADGRRTKTDSVAAAQMLVEDLAQVNTRDEADAMVEIADSWAATDPRARQTFTGEKVTAGPEGVWSTRDGQAPRLVPMDAATAAELDAEMDLLTRAEGGGAPVTRIVAGANSLEYRRNVGEAAQTVVERLNARQNVGGDVLTLIHERVEATWRAAIEAGEINMAETFRALRRLEAALGRQVLSEDPSDAEVRETVSEMVTADVFGRRNDGKRVPAGALSKGIQAAIEAAVDPQERATLGKFRSFLRAVRAFWRNVFKTVAAIGKARRDGKLKDGDEWGTFVDKLMGVDAQVAHEGKVVKEATAELEMSPEAFSVTREQEKLIQGYLDFSAVPEEKQPVAKKALAAVGIGKVPDRGRVDRDRAAAIQQSRELVGRAWRGLTQGTATPEERALALSALEQGPVSSILHEFVSREVPNFDIRGAVINSPADFHQLALSVRSPFFESIKVAVVDTKNRVIGSQVCNVGTINESLAPVREIIAAVVSIVEKHSGSTAAGWIISHNHPSGDPRPSNADVDLTRRLVDATNIAGVPLLDHVVTNGKQYFSFRDQGMMSGSSTKMQVKSGKGKINLPEPPKPGTDFADWEAVSRDDLPKLDNEFTLSNIVKVTQTADPDHAHIFYLGTKLQLMAVERVDLYAQDDLAAKVARGVGREGAVRVAVSFPQKMSMPAGIGLLKKLQDAGRTIGFTVVDAVGFDANWNTVSARVQGLMEADAEYSGETFSLSTSAGLERLARQIENRAVNPREKAKAFNRMAADLAGMARSVALNEGNELVSKIGEIRGQARQMRARLVDEYEEAALQAGAGDVLSAADLATVNGQPFLSWLTEPTQGRKFRTRLMSRTRAAKLGKYDPSLHGDYDGASGIPAAYFNGNLMPDQVAQNAFEDGVLPEPSVDLMWDTIHKELASKEGWRQKVRAAEGQLQAARKKAAAEARAWEDDQVKAARAGKAASAERESKRALIILDKMLMALPAEVRSQVGGFTRVAELKTNAARFDYFAQKVTQIDRILERHLREKYLTDLTTLLRDARPKMAAGEKDKGKLGTNAHAWLTEAERIMGLDEVALEAEENEVERRQAAATLTPAEVQHYARMFDFVTDEASARQAVDQHAALLNLFGALRHRRAIGTNSRGQDISGPPIRNAAEMFAALEAAQEMVDSGRLGWFKEIMLRRERRARLRAQAIAESGSAGSMVEKSLQKEGEGTFMRGVRDYLSQHYSFEQFVSMVFGEGSTTHSWADDSSRRADLQYRDALIDREAGLREFLVSLWPRSTLRQRQRNLERLSTTKDVPGAPADVPRMSELDAVHFTMLWMDDDTGSREWLAAHGLGAQAQAAMEAMLSDEAKAIRRWLVGQYDAQYDAINAVYRRMYGVNLPRVKNYAPRLVDHGGSANEMQLDPLQEGRQLMAGFTKRRRLDTKSPPRQVDALSAYWQNSHAVEYWRAWAEQTSDFRGVFSHFSTQSAVKAAGGDSVGATLNEWLSILERNGVQAANGTWLMRRAMSGQAQVALVGKLGVLMKQAVAGIASISEVGFRDYAASLRRIVAGEAAITVRDAFDLPAVQRRMANLSGEVRVAVKGRGKTPIEANLDRALRAIGTDLHALDNAQVWLGDRIGWTDALFTSLGAAVTYDTAFREAKAVGQSDAEARAAAEERVEQVVSDTAQPMTARDKGLVELRHGMLARMLQPFQSANRQALARIMLGVQQGRWQDVARDAALYFVVQGVIQQTLGNLFRSAFSDDDMDEIWEWEDYARAVAVGPLTAAFFFGPMLEAVVSWFGGFERREAPNTFAKGVSLLGRALREDDWDFKTLQNVLTAAGYAGGRMAWAGIVANVMKQAEGLVDTVTRTDAEREAEQVKADRALIQEEKKKNPKPERPEEQKAADAARRRAREAAQAEAIRNQREE